MRLSILLFGLLIAACGGGPGSTPDSVAYTTSCYGSWDGQTCHVVFDDGQRGITGPGYICKGSVYQ